MKENFDDILRRKLEAKHFPADEHHRAEMIALLNGKRRRRAFPFWWAGGIGILALSAGLYLWTVKHSASPDVKPQSTNRLEVKAPVKDQIASDNSAGRTSQEISTAAVSSTNASTESKAETTITPSPNNQTETSGKALPANSSNNTIPSTIQKTQHSAIPVSPQKRNANKLPDQVSMGSKQSHMLDVAAVPSDIITSAIPAAAPDHAELQDPVKSADPAVAEIRTAGHIGHIDPLDLSGIMYAFNPTPGQVTPVAAFKKSFYLFAEAGAGMILAAKPDYTTGWKLRAGAGLGYTLSPKIQLSWSAGYLMQQGGFDFQRTSTVDQPAFGARSSFNSLTPERLHFVYTRLGAQYRMGRHILGLHGGLQWLYGAQGAISIMTQDQFHPNASESEKFSWVKTDGLRTLHWTADLSYGYQITPRLMAAAGTDIYFSSFTVEDIALTQEGYYWDGAFATLHPFITLKYLIYGIR